MPDGWRAVALAPPWAHGGPAGTARLKAADEDFVVDEAIGFAADGGDAHRLLYVEKRGCTTLAVAGELARLAGCAARDVGFAGLKDRHAVARQYFTVPAPRPPRELGGSEGPGFRVLAAQPHSRKLRRGALAGNAFAIVLRELAADRDALAARIAAVVARGVPNYFGPQRFGRDGSNLAAIAAWLDGAAPPRAREARAFLYSSARALYFNAVLARRVVDGSWDGLLDGELVNLAGRNSWFAAASVDAALAARLAQRDIHGTGPLAGRDARAAGAAGVLEDEVAGDFGGLREALAQAGLEGARRPLRLFTADFRAETERGTLKLSFRLPPGAYATAVIRELVTTPDNPPEPHDD